MKAVAVVLNSSLAGVIPAEKRTSVFDPVI